MLPNRSDSQSRSKPQKSKTRGIHLISNTFGMKNNEVKLVRAVRVTSHSKSKSHSLLGKDGNNAVKYCTGGVGEAGITQRGGNQIGWHFQPNVQYQLKTCRQGMNVKKEVALQGEKRTIGCKTSERAVQKTNEQIQQIILRSAYYKVREKEMPKLKIELKRV